MDTTKRLSYISWIQFIGVLCVIFGHSMNDVAIPEFFRQVKYWIYTFHMPLFFMVSAYLFSYNGGFAHKGGYRGTFSGKFSRLIIPYIIWNLLFIYPKVAMADYTNDQVELTPQYFGMLMLYPRNNILGHTWFLFALFEMFVLAIIMEKIKQNKLFWIPVACVLAVVNCLGGVIAEERFLAISDLMKNGIFFWLGLLLGTMDVTELKSISTNRQLMQWTLGIILGCTIIWSISNDGIKSSQPANMLLLGIAIILFLGMLQMKFNICHPFIEFVSRNSFAIYIMHWPILMVVRFVVYQKMHIDPIITMCLMFFGGIVIASFFLGLLTNFSKKSSIIKSVSKVVFGM